MIIPLTSENFASSFHLFVHKLQGEFLQIVIQVDFDMLVKDMMDSDIELMKRNPTA